ncbi:MAG: tRNA (guanosine(46)-N7)-methyltransferase TrmB [Pseudomonadota bacterium]|nr:MAG: tRNA (guanosine(46)-N7)-methyltransferase TrmB [Pseudomonadota bacterium]
MGKQPPPRRIRSFVRREGRITKAQQRALDDLLPRYGIAPDKPIDFVHEFGRDASCILEIGFGNGEVLAQLAQRHPDNNYLGIEVHRPGVGSFLNAVEALGLENVRVICADAAEVLGQQVPDASLDALLLLFPDPWHKKRHHKRRLVQPAFAQLVRRKLKFGGRFHMATDWEDYAEHAMQVLSVAPGFRNIASAGGFAAPPDWRTETKFERRGRRLGHGVRDLIFERVE